MIDMSYISAMPGTSAILCTRETCRFASLKHIPLHPKWCPWCQKKRASRALGETESLAECPGF